MHEFRREWNFELQFFQRGQSPSLEFVDVLWRVYQQDVRVRGGLRSNEVGRVSNASLNQPIMNAPVFLGWEDVLPDGQVVFVAVDKLAGKHASMITLNIDHTQ